MSMLLHLLFFFCNGIVPYCPHGPVTVHGAKQRSSFCHLFSLLLSPPPPLPRISLLTIEVQRETYMFASGGGVRRGVENKEQFWRRDSLHLNVCLFVLFWLTLSVWSLGFSFQFLSSDVRRWCTMRQEALLDKRHCALYICFLNIHLFSRQGSVCFLASVSSSSVILVIWLWKNNRFI